MWFYHMTCDIKKAILLFCAMPEVCNMDKHCINVLILYHVRQLLTFPQTVYSFLYIYSYCAEFEITSTRRSCQSPLLAEWAPQLTRGSTVCVECQPLAMHRKLGVRCRGHGAFMRETRWSAATVPGCHGQWMMKTRHEDCSCNKNKEESFILL